MRRFFALFFVVLVAAGVKADSIDWLAANGYPAEQFELLQTWQELNPAGAGEMATGYSLLPRDGGPRIDVYRIGNSVVSGSGIQPKSWNGAPISVSTIPGHASGKSGQSQTGVAFAVRAPDLTLPPLPQSASKAEEEADASKGVWRTGDYRAFPEAITLSSFLPGVQSKDQLVYSIKATGAQGIRLHVESLQLPAGASLHVHAGGETFGPYTEAGSDGLWTPTLYDDQIDIFVSDLPTQQRDTAVLRIPGLIHMYRGFDFVQNALAGSCNLDVTCHPAWATTALGIGLMGTAGPGGSLFCTGTLIADASDCLDVPLFLTANHCVATQSKASSLEFYWEFQSAVCDGLPPNVASVPRTTGGAVLLATQQGTGFGGGGNDFTLLRLNNEPPANITRVGWTTDVPALGTEITCIHHPRTEYKRISFGTITDTDNTFPALFHEATWDDGTTEPGSSGSPLMLTSTQQIIGQLWGGGASCSQPLEPDYYGRFDVTYSIAAAHLDPTPVAAFTQADFVAGEGAGTALITFTLSAPAESGGVAIAYTFNGGTATANTDYLAGSGVVNIAGGQDSGSFPVVILQDMTADDGETIEMTLSIQSGCAKPSAVLATTTLTINDDDADTDGDGISDFDETNGTYGYVTDPNEADSDGDGLTDSEEVFGEFGYNTDPNLSDTDGDGYEDYSEILLGTDPTVFTATGLSSLTIPQFR